LNWFLNASSFRGTKSRPRSRITSGRLFLSKVGRYVSKAVLAVTTACRSRLHKALRLIAEGGTSANSRISPRKMPLEMTSRVSSFSAFTSSRSDPSNASSVLRASCSSSLNTFRRRSAGRMLSSKICRGLSMVHSKMMIAPSSMYF
jgi:hypothetical protein